MNLHFDSRRKTYVCDFKLRGQRMRLTVNASNERTAWVMVPDLIAEEVLRGLTAAPKRDESPRLADFVESWLESALTHAPASEKPYRSRSLALARIIGDLTLSSIGDAAITRYVAARKAEAVTPASINHELTILRMILGLAHKRGIIATIPDIERIPAEKIVRQPFTPEQVEAFYAALPASYRDVVEFVAETGMRRREVVKAQRSDVQGKGRDAVILVRGKRAKQRLVPLTEKAQAIVARQPIPQREATGSLFNVNYASLGNAIADALDKIGLRGGFRGLHTIRRTMATALYRANKPLAGIQALLGHSTQQTTMIYCSADLELVRKVFDIGTDPATRAPNKLVGDVKG